jgi:predicted nuclease of predicted toxin-antitoxin system
VKPLDFPLLADENIHPEVVRCLAEEGKDVTSVVAEGLNGEDDSVVLSFAYARGRVVVTHDADFGSLAVHRGEPFIGIIHLRPGHVRAAFVLESVAALASIDADVGPPFVVVAERRGASVRIRQRQL